jgi:hypothetical protein
LVAQEHCDECCSEEDPAEVPATRTDAVSINEFTCSTRIDRELTACHQAHSLGEYVGSTEDRVKPAWPVVAMSHQISDTDRVDVVL